MTRYSTPLDAVIYGTTRTGPQDELGNWPGLLDVGYAPAFRSLERVGDKAWAIQPRPTPNDCTAHSCNNGFHDVFEMAVDCGGPCPPCEE